MATPGGGQRGQGDGSDGPVLLSIEPLSDRYDAADDRWLDQVASLRDQLREEVGDVRRQLTPAPGQKGGVETVILALGSAGAFTAAVEVFRAWLGRDRSRRLRLVVAGEDLGPRIVEIQGEAIDSRTIREVADVIARRLRLQ